MLYVDGDDLGDFFDRERSSGECQLFKDTDSVLGILFVDGTKNMVVCPA